ncbi:MAG TPA: hypothetical protein VFW07_03375 [Parafilimonas sp.]|nr:hypothetical protein [Parafilimonas sp.]
MAKITVLVWALLLGSDVFAQSQTEKDLFSLLQEGKYVQLVNKVCSLREKQYYKNAFMDYCLAYGYCQLDKPSLSGEWFDHILGSYNSLSSTKRDELEQLKGSCSQSHPNAQVTNALFEYLHAMSADGFEGNQAGIESKMGVPSLKDTVEEFDFEHLTFDRQNRKFTLQQKREALDYYRRLLSDPEVHADTTAHFLVFWPGNPMLINNHMKQLEEYYSFYSSMFNLQESNMLITVFYCTNRNDFNTIAKQVHNIPVPKSTFGYASSIDLVMMGIANAAWLGAMKHELFHLMIRSFVGDIPPWLDEGAACYFESSTLKNNNVTTNLSGSNYRVNLLKQRQYLKHEISDGKGIKMPTLPQLTNYNWQEFSGKSGNLMIQASINQSISYVFVSYLQDRKLLGKTMEAFRNRAYTDPSSNDSTGLIILHLRTNDELLTNTTGMTMPEIQADFYNWCQGKGIPVLPSP